MKQSLLAWVCLISAAFCEMGWTYSVRFLKIGSLKALRWETLIRPAGGLSILGPWLAYFLFGILNTVLLAIALRTVATATAFAIWMALSLVFTKWGDVIWFKADWSWTELFFMGVILVGVIGLKLFNAT